VDGVLLKKQKLVYYAVNKPVGFVTTNRDPHGRPRVIDLVPPDERVFPVGRLDRSSEGLILLTNDGELAQKLTHPKFGVRKVYRVTVAGKVDGETMKKMRQGIYIAEGFVKVEGAKLLKSRSRATEMEIVLKEGKNREIRRILARLGHKVQQLRRIAVGPLRLGDVPAGAYRIVTPGEVEKLWTATQNAAETEGQPRSLKSQNAKNRGAKKRGTKKRGVHAAASGPQRRPLKKPRSATQAPAGKFPYSLGESRSSGVIIGGEPSTESDDNRKSRRGTKKQTKRSVRPKHARRASGPGASGPGASGPGGKKGTGKGPGKKFPSTGSGGKPRPGAKKKRRKP
jgi:23S rRNA pseudouridine2605 synthase